MARRHIVREWSLGYRQLVSGLRPFHLCPEETARTYGTGDELEVLECDRGRLTGAASVFRITSVVRRSDHEGAYEALLPRNVVVLGLRLASAH